MPTLQITILQPKDDALAIQLAQIFYDHPLTPEKAKGLLASDTAFLICGKVDNEIIGFCFFHLLPRWYDQEPEIFFYDIEVLPQYQRKGYGRLLFEAVVEFARERKIEEIWLLTNESYQEAVPFYKALGGEVEAALLVSFGVGDDEGLA